MRGRASRFRPPPAQITLIKHAKELFTPVAVGTADARRAKNRLSCECERFFCVFLTVWNFCQMPRLHSEKVAADVRE